LQSICSCQSPQITHDGCANSLRPLVQDHQIRKYADPMDLQHVPLGPALVHLRMQVLQAEDVPSLHLQRLSKKQVGMRQDPSLEILKRAAGALRLVSQNKLLRIMQGTQHSAHFRGRWEQPPTTVLSNRVPVPNVTSLNWSLQGHSTHSSSCRSIPLRSHESHCRRHPRPPARC